jgi:hypothetical protein
LFSILCAYGRYKRDALESSTIVCSAETQGRRCGATARVLSAHYVYKPASKNAQQLLVEARYQIHCPKCGPRTQVEYFENA